jgi:ribosomal protein L37AE/L43A
VDLWKFGKNGEKPQMKENKRFRCICCGKPTLNRTEGGWWVHKQCLIKTAMFLKAYEVEIPLICQQIVFSSKRCLEASLLSLGDKKFQAIQKSVRKKATEIFLANHPTPWIKK